jgi:hypothetical protein
LQILKFLRHQLSRLLLLNLLLLWPIKLSQKLLKPSNLKQRLLLKLLLNQLHNYLKLKLKLKPKLTLNQRQKILKPKKFSMPTPTQTALLIQMMKLNSVLIQMMTLNPRKTTNLNKNPTMKLLKLTLILMKRKTRIKRKKKLNN